MRLIALYTAGLLSLSILLTGCADNGLYVQPADGGTYGTYTAIFRFNVAVDDDKERTRANDWSDETPGDDPECHVGSLHLFVVPVTATPDGQETEHWEDVLYGEANPDSNPAEVEIAHLPTVPLLNLYVAANLNESQVRHIISENRNEYFDLTNDNYETAIEEIAPFTRNRTRNDIVMFANDPARVNAEKLQSTDSSDGKKIIEAGSVTLKRVAAKVLLTCVSIPGGSAATSIAPGSLEQTDYVTAKGIFLSSEKYMDNGVEKEVGIKGWFRQKDIRFFINNMPRQAKFRQIYTDTDEDGIAETLTPNYNLRERLNLTSVSFSPLTYNEQEIQNWYYHYTRETLYARGQGLYQQSLVWSESEYQRLIGTDYTSSIYHGTKVGLYTLENVYGVNDGDFSETERAQMKNYNGLPFVTHVSIAAKFTPRILVVTDDEWNQMKNNRLGEKTLEEQTVLVKNYTTGTYGNSQSRICDNEEVSKAILNYSLELAGKLWNPSSSDPDTYPSDTFFTYASPGEEGMVFATFGTASMGNNGKIWSNMECYHGGWIFYYTYLNNETDAPVEHIEQAIIERNRYYILQLNSIGTIGESSGTSHYIQVHTLKSPWREGGEGNLTLN